MRSLRSWGFNYLETISKGGEVLSYILLYTEELLNDWELAQKGEPLNRIEPLK